MAYSPASVVTSTSGLNHLAQIYYDRLAVDNLKAHLVAYQTCERRRLPNKNGKTIQLFTYKLFGANTTPGTEGTVGAGQNPTTNTVQTSVSQYFDYMSFSDILVETAIDPIVENSAVEFGYRAALTNDTLAFNAYENAVTLDSSVSNDLGAATYMSASLARHSVMSLRGRNVRPKADGFFYGIIHPFVAFDLLNDNTTGGYIDTRKYTESGEQELMRGVQGYRVAEFGGVRFFETTTVPTYANYQSGTGYATYIVGKDALFSVSLGATETPGDKNFRLITRNWANDPSVADPAGVIGASVAYNFKQAYVPRPGSTMGFRRIRSLSSIS